MSAKYFIWNIGCQMNDADARRLAARLEFAGYEPAKSVEEASLVVVNSCVVRQQAEDRVVRQLLNLKALKRRSNPPVIALMGCLVTPASRAELARRFPWVDAFAPASAFQALFQDLGLDADRWTNGEEPVLAPSLTEPPVSVEVPVVLGCSHACTYCVIPSRRGRERSRPLSEVLREIRRLAERGVREVVLLGQIVDRYGMDLEERVDLAALLERAAVVPGIRRVRFLTNHPSYVTDRLIETVASTEGVCPYFELPVQSGNDEILARMRRGYTVNEYRRVVDRIRERIPDVALYTDVIVGFPGETTQQFEDTVRLLDDLQPDLVHIAKYSERPNTWAARHLRDDVPEAEKERRRVMLEEQQKQRLVTAAQRWRGKVVEVLVEELDSKGRWRGRTPQNKLVFFEDTRPWRGEVASVEITHAGPFAFVGRVAAGLKSA